jgi:hypothetical protein
MDSLLQLGDEVDSSHVDFVAHVYVMPILLLIGEFLWGARDRWW